eukprot:CAMPEP_0117578146 /NCGR_PEP_ID=MMETSP0784-20121206/63833_1 /TAXON_ID=39447 /ORGANISM="" /LENGTH=70 /DNA_ID=CAMNT_0005377761 /DNA_START=178 /DNA_END=386 /DNA_ORIENTATION=-
MPIVRQRPGGTHNDEAATGPRQHDVQAPPVCQEADLALLVASDRAEDDELLLPSLVGVHRSDLEAAAAAA